MKRGELTLDIDEKPTDADVAAVVDGLRAFNARQRGGRRTRAKKFCVYLRDADGTIAGGLVALTHLDWMYVDYLWIDGKARGRGWGTRLMAAAEVVARRHGCLGVWLDTMSFQAPGFYKKLGFRQFGALRDLSTPSRRFWLWKRLTKTKRGTKR